MGLASFGAHAQDNSKVLDDFSDASGWRVVTSNQVSGSLRQVDGAQGKALCLDYDFNGVSGYAGIQRDLAITYPKNYRFDFQLRGDSPNNDLQFKLVDASGDNVWWVNKPKYDYPRGWTGVVYKKRHIDKAWGPDPDRVLRNSAKLEFTIYNNAGGKGSVCFDELTLTGLPAEDHSPLTATASASVANGSGVAILSDLVHRPWSLEGKRIETLTVTDPVTPMSVGLAWHRERAFTPAMQAFRDYFHDAFLAPQQLSARR